ncbi:cytoplasmic RNA-binding protein [Candida orthopsilosis Co 90-125]|uniref:Cytoplasmic RNA-binding protein n=1 Tax=Candida orthopsilosis (strain 90-125) TaxID=1136231 RepID=H8XBJ7_CANO9|nr:cytoplasmic RNA-binding protein [Candida orthopsilosis Co 90-125]CCG25185.1 cytoplasmic RNA-binding protein [Candida orthopsilosis Co 90-125]
MSDQISYEQQSNYLEARVQPQSSTQEQSQPQELTIEELEQEKRRLQELDAVLDAQDHNTYTNPDLVDSSNSGDASGVPTAAQLDAERRESDARSVYIGNVDYPTTPLELQQHFSPAGTVNRVTIMTNKVTGQPKGFAYLEFSDVDSMNKAVATLDGSIFRDRPLKVLPKRTNIPGVNANRGGSRGRGRAGFRGRGAFRGRAGFRGRGRGAPRFNPY